MDFSWMALQKFKHVQLCRFRARVWGSEQMQLFHCWVGTGRTTPARTLHQVVRRAVHALRNATHPASLPIAHGVSYRFYNLAAFGQVCWVVYSRSY